MIALRGIPLKFKVRAGFAWKKLRPEQQAQLRDFGERIGLAALGQMATEAIALVKTTARNALPEILRAQVNREARRFGLEMTPGELDIVVGFLVSLTR